MTKSRTRRKIDPLALRILDLAAVGLPASAAVLDTQADIHIVREGSRDAQKHVAKHDMARRFDAFLSLKEGMAPGAYDAARRLERDVYVSMGLHDRSPGKERVDCDESPGRMDAMLIGAERAYRVLQRVSDRDRWLLRELIEPARDYGGWRACVAYITGETHAHGQGAAVRAACVNLRDAYAALEERSA